MILVILIAIAIISVFLLWRTNKGFHPLIVLLSIGISAIGLVLMFIIDLLFNSPIPIGEGTLVKVFHNSAYVRFNKEIIECGLDLTTKVDGKPGDVVTIEVCKGNIFGFEFYQYAELKNEEQH